MDAERESLFVQTGAMTLGTLGSTGKLFGPFLRRGRCIPVLLHLYVFHYALIRCEIIGSPTNQRTFDVDTLVGPV